ncbi:MAG TPA: aminopeptidase [Gammaproteobacteria bacterium]|nr:aminopeptidase [Gammaproteobacteria bacterium]
MMHRRLRLLAAVLLGAASSGCATLSYYTQAVHGQIRLMAQRESIERLLHAPDTPAALKTRLALVLSIRNFASRALKLPDNGSYRSYVALHRPYVSWVVFAAPAFSLQPIQWCYPVIGCAVYRGYFQHAGATTLAGHLRRVGYDVYVGGVPAYSTLGWFSDPVLSTVIDWPADQLAGLIFHELAHQELFIAGDSRFDESFAVAVQEAGVDRWLEHHGTPAERAAYRIRRQRQATLFRLIRATRQRLVRLYASAQPAAAKRVAKARLFDALVSEYRALETSWGGTPADAAGFAHDLNNAKLAALETYQEYVPAFHILLAREHGDFAAFYRTARALGRLPKRERHQVLAAIASGEPSQRRGARDGAHAPEAHGTPGALATTEPTNPGQAPGPVPVSVPRRAGAGMPAPRPPGV